MTFVAFDPQEVLNQCSKVEETISSMKKDATEDKIKEYMKQRKFPFFGRRLSREEAFKKFAHRPKHTFAMSDQNLIDWVYSDDKARVRKLKTGATKAKERGVVINLSLDDYKFLFEEYNFEYS